MFPNHSHYNGDDDDDGDDDNDDDNGFIKRSTRWLFSLELSNNNKNEKNNEIKIKRNTLKVKYVIFRNNVQLLMYIAKHDCE